MRASHALALAKGAATYLPFAYALFGQKRMMPAGVTAQYCYGVWFKHALLVNEISGAGIPNVVVELGPGDTIGVGIAALLSGASRYIGVDCRPFLNASETTDIANEMITLFRDRHTFPKDGWSEIRHLLDEESFPSALMGDAAHPRLPSDDKVFSIMRDLRLVLEGDRSKMLKYATHPTDPAVGPDDSVDLVISQSVLEHVVDLRTFLTKSYRWLKPGGYASHQFDLTSHDIVPGWDEHRSFSDDSWKLVVGRRAFMINRLPYSAIIAIFEECGFHVLRADRLRMQHTVPRARLAESWSAVSDDDLDTLGGYVIAQKPR